MKTLLKLKKELKALPKKIFNYYIDLIVRTFKYVRQIVYAAGINALVMIPLVQVTRLVMNHFGFVEPTMIAGDDPFSGLSVPVLAVMCLGIGIFEETYFRYLIMECLMGKALKWPKWMALVVSSCIFGAAHLANPGGWLVTLPQAVGAAGAGFWFAHIYKKHGLHFAILTHALYDFAIFILALYIK